MPILTLVAALPTPSAGAMQYCQIWKAMSDFLLARGWTCAGSSNGTTGGMDGSNRMTTAADWQAAATTRWLVLTSPHPTVGERMQLCFGSSATSYQARFGAAWGTFASASTAEPTGGSIAEMVMGTSSVDVAAKIHMAYDTDTYEWGVYVTANGDSTRGRFFAAHVRLAAVPPYGSPKSYTVVYHQHMFTGTANTDGGESDLRLASWLTLSGNSSGNGRWLANPRGAIVQCGASLLSGTGATSISNVVTDQVPCGAATDPSGNDTAFPMVLLGRAGVNASAYIGVVSDFLTWNGQVRNNLDSTGPGGATDYSRLYSRYCSFKWDGVTVPVQ
jgi:hypothetical protein